MKRSTLAAVLGNVVSLLALWLVNFGVELTAEQQAEIVSALLLIVNTCALIIPAIVAAMKPKPEPPPVDREAGHASPMALAALAVAAVLLVALALPGCGLQPRNPSEALALGYTAHASLTRQVTASTTSGAITVDQAEQARDALRRALVNLDNARLLLAANKPAADPLQRASQLLQVVEQILLERTP